jgi:hypothetical protein
LASSATFSLALDRYQLGVVLFDNIKNAKDGNLGYKCKVWAEKGSPEVSESSLQEIDLPFVKDYVEYMSLQKVLSTNLEGIAEEIDSNGILHPSFNLNTVQTYRSSSSEPNFQNMPVRNKNLSEIVRRCFIARPGNHFVEIDYSSAEVRCNASINGDPKLKQYTTDPNSDMHKDMAVQIFKLLPKQITKLIRNIAKGGFVFAAFYGSWWVGLAEGLWDQVRVQNPKTADNIPLMEHLQSVGFGTLGTLDSDGTPESDSFYEHIKNIETDFWGNRFTVAVKDLGEIFTKAQKKSWRDVAKIVKALCEENDPEEIRYAVLGWLNSALLGGWARGVSDVVLAEIISYWVFSFYESKKTGVTLAAFRSWAIK